MTLYKQIEPVRREDSVQTYNNLKYSVSNLRILRLVLSDENRNHKVNLIKRFLRLQKCQFSDENNIVFFLKHILYLSIICGLNKKNTLAAVFSLMNVY